MQKLRDYFADIGRRGGIRSRRVLEPETARRMVRIREARRAARRAARAIAVASIGGDRRDNGTAADTSVGAQAVQDALIRRMSSAEKLAQVARLSRMVDLLATEGLKQRHPADSDAMIRRRRAELRLGPELAARVLRG